MRVLSPRNVVILLTLAALTAGIVGSTIVPTGNSGPWGSGWHVVMFSPETPISRIEGYLASWGLHDVISKDDQTVEVADYAGDVTRIALSELAARIPPGDPRRDQWTDSLPDWFVGTLRGQELSIAYVRSGFVEGLAPGLFRSGLEKRGAILISAPVESEISDSMAWRAFALAVACGSILMIVPSRRRIALLMALPWLVGLLLARGRGGAMALAGFLGLSVALDSLMSGEWKTEGFDFRAWARSALAFLVPGLVVSILLDSAGTAMVARLAISSTMVGMLAFRIVPPPGRRAFVAVPILRTSPSIRPVRDGRQLALLGLLAILTGMPYAVKSSLHPSDLAGDPVLPMPLGRFRSTEAASSNISLPGLAQLEGHLQNERSFFDSPLSQRNEAEVARGAEPSRSASIVPSWPPREQSEGIERLVRQQGSDVGFARIPFGSGGGRPLALWRVLLYIIVATSAIVTLAVRSRSERRRPGPHP